MKLLTFTLPSDPAHRLGLLTPDDRVVDLKGAADRSGGALPFDAGSMLSLIAAGLAGLAAAAELAKQAGNPLALADIRVLAPIPRPRKNVFCVGWNYLEHFQEGAKLRPNQELPAHPAFFSKCATAVLGPFDPVPYDPSISDKWDWEVELGVVIGRGGKNISEGEAPAHVFGYTVVNDVSVRDLQRRHGGQWFKGKSLDGTCPFGPWIVTADELDAGNLRVTTRVNGVVKQDSGTQHMYFKVPHIIAELSLGMTLEPGDLISTGTPQGVGFARTPPEYLKAGDVMETEIEGIGCLRNRIGI
ncbi:MAG: fumarylacetoacetate hydrolase family protein [Betaproteobacteria bacterium]|nr:fumarylacetoacetate hydrolase family protein [Betaproteobacteria bacterium]